MLRIERANLADIVHHALETCAPPIEEKQHRLTVTIPLVPVYVDADSARLSQALCNLLVNAAKFTPNGGDITLDMHRAGGDAVITIKDSGVGIATDLLGEVFEMFTQADRSLETSQGGLGIGLSIVRRLVEMHGGTVEAKSAGLGGGSEFIVKLPVAVVQAEDIERINNLPISTSGAGRRILVADDNEDAVESLALMLTMMGNETRTAARWARSAAGGRIVCTRPRVARHRHAEAQWLRRSAPDQDASMGQPALFWSRLPAGARTKTVAVRTKQDSTSTL